MEGCTDGTFQMTGQKYFDCQDGRGLYYPLTWLRPIERFIKLETVPVDADVPNCKYFYVILCVVTVLSLKKISKVL